MFLYAQYIPSTSPVEILSGVTWSPTAVPIPFSFAPITLINGEIVQSTFGVKIGDLIEYSKEDFLQVQATPQTFKIITPYNAGRLVWKYNPFISFQLRYFSSDLNQVNTGSTSYDQTTAIPYYATKIDNFGNFVWRDILPQGYFDPTTDLGVDYPFVNQKRYLFSNVILDITPDLNDPATLAAFSEIWFSRYATSLKITPISNINNIGKPCL